jgi:hypothetical protein
MRERLRYAGHEILRVFWILCKVVLGLVLLACAMIFILGDRSCKVSGYSPMVSATSQAPLGVLYRYHHEGRGYLNFPLWYLRWNQKDFQEFTKTDSPSDFTYLTAEAQYWCGYEAVTGLTYRAGYPIDIERHVALWLLGAEFTVENDARFLYEHTIGWVTGWHLPAPQVLKDPVEQGTFYLTVSEISSTLAAQIRNVRVIGQVPDTDQLLLEVPRDSGLLAVLTELANRGASFKDIEGNSNIALSVVIPTTHTEFFPEAHQVISMPIPTQPGFTRLLFSVPIVDLAVALTNFKAQKRVY